MMRKKRIVVLVVAGLGSLLIGLALFAYYNFTHNFHILLTKASWQASDAQIAFQGAIGEAIFSGQGQEVVSDAELEGKNGLDAVLASVPADKKGQGLIEAYQKDPQKFKRYSEMLDTAMTARQLGDALFRQGLSHPPATSQPLTVEARLKIDAWGSPFCIIPVGERVAIVSGGPSRLSCDALPLTAEQIAKSNRNMYAGPSAVVVVIATHRRAGEPESPHKTPPGS